MRDYKQWLAYRKGYELAMEIFQVSKTFPSEEKFSLTDQIRRCSRAVCTNLAESSRRRRYRDYFIAKLNDSETENSETEVWLNIAKDCKYLTENVFEKLIVKNGEVGKLIWYMTNHPEQF